MNSDIIKSITSQFIPTLLYTPYYTILLLIQTNFELEHDEKIDRNLTSFQLIEVFIENKGLLTLWSGYVFNLVSIISVQLSNTLITWYFQLDKIESDESILKRFFVFLFAISAKTVLSWVLGFWCYYGYIWKCTDFDIKSKSKENEKKNKKRSISYRKKFSSFKDLINKLKVNLNLAICLFLLNLIQSLLFLTIEFLFDWIYLKIIPKSIHPRLQSILLRSLITFTCTFVVWPLQTLTKCLTVGNRYTTNSKLTAKQIFQKLWKNVKNHLYNGYFFGFMSQFISVLCSVVVALLTIQKSKDVPT